MGNNNGRFKAKDLAGQRNGFVVAIAPTDKRAKDGSTIWLMQCDCGTEFERSAGRFRKSISCGCKSHDNSGQYKVLDLTGYESSSSIALYPTDKRRHTYTVWVMRCLLCGETFETAAYNITRGQAAHRCPAWIEKYHPRIGRPVIPDNGAHINALYSHYKHSAASRSIPLELTKEQAQKLFEQECHYCGASPRVSYTHQSLRGEYAWNGIDRVDNRLGYTVDNCVACCTQCNFAKRDMTQSEFKDWIKRAYQHLFG